MQLKKMLSRAWQLPQKELYRIAVKTEENSIYLESKPDYSDNAWVLFQYMIENNFNDRYHIYWVADTESEAVKNIPNVTVVLRKNHAQVVKTLYKCKYVFYTHGLTGWIRIKPQQVVVNLWHGCGYKASRNAGVNRKRNLSAIINSGKMAFNYVLVPGNAFIKTKSEFFQCPEEKVLPLGYPRYDLLHSACPEWEEAKRQWGVGDRKIVIWLPTYRQTGDKSYKEGALSNQYWLPQLHNDEELKKLNDICEEKGILLIVKKHMLQNVFFKENLSSILLLDNSDFDKLDLQLYAMLQFTSGLITDYSSVAVDYLLLDKPIGFTLGDYDEYAQARGFVFEDAKKFMPGNHIYNLDDFAQYLEQIRCGDDLHAHARAQVIPQLHSSSEHYCQRVVDHFKISNVQKESSTV